MPVKNIEYKGRKMLFADFNGMEDQEELLRDAKKASETLLMATEHMFFLCDFTDASVGKGFMATIKDDAKKVLRTIPLTTAVTGITGLKQILVQGYIRVTGSKMRIFNTLEEAKEYLATKEI